MFHTGALIMHACVFVCAAPVISDRSGPESPRLWFRCRFQWVTSNFSASFISLAHHWKRSLKPELLFHPRWGCSSGGWSRSPDHFVRVLVWSRLGWEDSRFLMQTSGNPANTSASSRCSPPSHPPTPNTPPQKVSVEQRDEVGVRTTAPPPGR